MNAMIYTQLCCGDDLVHKTDVYYMLTPNNRNKSLSDRGWLLELPTRH